MPTLQHRFSHYPCCSLSLEPVGGAGKQGSERADLWTGESLPRYQDCIKPFSKCCTIYSLYYECFSLSNGSSVPVWQHKSCPPPPPSMSGERLIWEPGVSIISKNLAFYKGCFNGGWSFWKGGDLQFFIKGVFFFYKKRYLLYKRYAIS